MTEALRLLAERVEKASGPDREMDAAIMFDLFAKPVGKHKADGGPTGYLWPEDNPSWSFGLRFPGKDREWFTSGKKRRPYSCSECGARDNRETLLIERDGAFVLMNELRIPALTASLDAAMTLVPEGWSLSMGERRGRPEHIRWEVWLADHNTADGIAEFHVEANAATPALALCAAALRARAAQEQRNEP